MPDPTAAATSELTEALADASMIVATFRRRLREAGFPFAEPSGVSEILSRADALCFPHELKTQAPPKNIELQIPVL